MSSCYFSFSSMQMSCHSIRPAGGMLRSLGALFSASAMLQTRRVLFVEKQEVMNQSKKKRECIERNGRSRSQSSSGIPSGLFKFSVSTPGRGHCLANACTSFLSAFTSSLASATRRKSLRSFEPASFWSCSESWTARCRKDATTLWSASAMLREVSAEVPRRMPPGVWADSVRRGEWASKRGREMRMGTHCPQRRRSC